MSDGLNMTVQVHNWPALIIGVGGLLIVFTVMVVGWCYVRKIEREEATEAAKQDALFLLWNSTGGRTHSDLWVEFIRAYMAKDEPRMRRAILRAEHRQRQEQSGDLV